MDIILAPVGAVDPIILNKLQNDLTPILQKPVRIRKGLAEPAFAYNPVRNQFFSTGILKVLLEEKELQPYERILGLVDHDLYVPELNFVFGEASNRGAVIALTRLRESYYGKPETPGLFRRRVSTEAVHELSHTYGLNHCRNVFCVMYFSNQLADTDRKGPMFCPKCKKHYDAFKRPG